MKRLALSVFIFSLLTISYSQQEKYAEIKSIVIPHPPKAKVKNSNYLMNFELNDELIFVRGVSAKSGANAFSASFASLNAYTKFIIDVFSKDFNLKSSNYVSGIMKNEKEGLFGRTNGILSFQHLGGKILFFTGEFNRSDFSLNISLVSYDIKTNKLSKRKELFSTKDLSIGKKSIFRKVENGSKILFSYVNGSNSKYILIDENLNLTKDSEDRVEQVSQLIKQDPESGKVVGVYDSKSEKYLDVDFNFSSAKEVTLDAMDTEGNGVSATHTAYKIPIPNTIIAFRNGVDKVDMIGIEYDEKRKTIGPKFIQYDTELEEKTIEKSNPSLEGYRSIESRGIEKSEDGYIYFGESITYKETGVAYPNYGTIFICGIGSDGKLKWTNKIERHIQENYIVQMADVGFRYMVKDDKGFVFYKGATGTDTNKKLKNKDLDGIYMFVIDKNGDSEKIKVINFNNPKHEALRDLKFSGNCFIDKINQAVYFIGNQKKGTVVIKLSLK